MTEDSSLRTYYNQRAQFYEKIYEKPERQNELAQITRLLEAFFRNETVFEIACGTGYWTQKIARTAQSVIGLDQSEETLALAREKNIANAQFFKGDAYNLAAFTAPPPQPFTAGFAGFWWSHIPRSKHEAFFENFHACFPSGAKIALLDNSFVPESSTPLSRTDPEGNSYQIRPLPDGTTHEILKNFPTPQDLTTIPATQNPKIHHFPHFWLLTYKLKDTTTI